MLCFKTGESVPETMIWTFAGRVTDICMDLGKLLGAASDTLLGAAVCSSLWLSAARTDGVMPKNGKP